MRMIDADALYKVLKDAEDLARQRVLDTESTLPYPNNLNPSYTRYLAQMDERMKAKEMVADAPTVDAAPVRHGYWIYHPDWQADGECGYECSACGMGSDVDYQFCMRCGAKMNKEDNEQKKQF